MNPSYKPSEEATSSKIQYTFTLTEMATEPQRLRTEVNFSHEDLRERLETKTALLEEVLQQFDRTEHRFWGINE
jgi:hypothetical protein